MYECEVIIFKETDQVQVILAHLKLFPQASYFVMKTEILGRVRNSAQGDRHLEK